MKRISFTFVLLTVGIALIFAQNKVTFDKTVHDFGNVDEKGGNVTCTFTLTNTSSEPIVINDASASCGCTKPSWSKEPIAPGKSGQISVTYHPLGRVGAISKNVSVYTSAQANPFVLAIKGMVLAAKPAPETEYPLAFGTLRLKQTNVHFGQMAVTETRKATIDVFNSSSSPVSLKFDRLPKYITVSCEPAAIPAKTAAKVTITVNAAAAKEYGKVKDSFNFIVGNDLKASAANVFEYTCIFTDDFSNVSQSDKANAPKMSLSQSQVNLVVEKDGKKASQVLKISNAGKTDLQLRNIAFDNQLITVSKDKATVKPGEIIELKLSAMKPLKGNVASIVSILSITSNDPIAPVRDVRVVANF